MKGDRIAVLRLPPSPGADCPFLPLRIGAIFAAAIRLFGPDALQYRLSNGGAKLVITDADSLEKLAPLTATLPDLSHLLVCGKKENLPAITGMDSHDPVALGWERADADN